MKKVLSHKEEKELISFLNEKFGIEYSKKEKFERDESIILINNEPLFFYRDGKIVPTLKEILKNNFLKKVTVDMGAVRFVVSGADIMRPGITSIDVGIVKDEIISIVDVTHSKPLAIGIALFSAEEMGGMVSGKVVRNIHFVGDKIWSYN